MDLSRDDVRKLFYELLIPSIGGTAVVAAWDCSRVLTNQFAGIHRHMFFTFPARLADSLSVGPVSVLAAFS